MTRKSKGRLAPGVLPWLHAGLDLAQTVIPSGGRTGWRLAILIILASLSCPAATYYIDAVNGSDYNTGLTPEAAWQTVAKINASVFSPGDSVLFRGGQTWFTTLKPPSSGSRQDQIVFGTYDKAAGVAVLANAADANGRNYITYDSLRFSGTQFRSFQETIGIRFYNCWFSGHGGTSIWAGNGKAQVKMEIDHCVFERPTGQLIIFSGGSDAAITNSIIVPGSVDDNPFRLTETDSIRMDYCMFMWYRAFKLPQMIDGGHNVWLKEPRIRSFSTNVTPRFVFTVDDSSSVNSWASAILTAFDPYNAKTTMFVNMALGTAEQKALMASLAAAGHEISNHTLNHEDLTATQAFTVTTSNADATVDVDAPTSTITLSTSTPGNTVVLEWSGRKKISDLKDAVAGKGWTITNSLQHGKTRRDTLLLDELADSEGPQSVPYTALLDIEPPQYRFYHHEINDNQDYIEQLVGVRPKTMAYPYGFYDERVVEWLKTNTESTGIITARDVGGGFSNLASVKKFHVIERPSYWTTTDSEETVREWARRCFVFAINMPAYYLVYFHATESAHWERLTWFVDEISRLGAQVVTYGELATWIAADHEDNGTVWTKSYDTTRFDPTLLGASPGIDAGVMTGWTVDAMGRAAVGIPDIGLFEYQPTWEDSRPEPLGVKRSRRGRAGH